MVKLKNLIENTETQPITALTTEEKKTMWETVKSYNAYRNQLKSNNVYEAVARISNAVELAERYSIKECGDWMEAKMISGDMKEMKKLSAGLYKESSKLKEVEQQMEMLYEQLGIRLERYFEMDNEEATHAPPENLLDGDDE
jgi:hypothetical protein